MIFIPPGPYQGGVQRFMGNLTSCFDRHAIHYVSDRSSPSIGAVFVPVQYDLDYLEKAKKRGARIIQRLDGIHYPEKHGKAYTALNQKLGYIYHHLADHLIFQSIYSRKQCEAVLGPKFDDRSSAVIVNGTATALFHPADGIRRLDMRDIRFITTGNFRNMDMIEPIIRALDLLRKKHHGFRLAVVGRIGADDRFRALLDRAYVDCVPHVAEPGGLAEMLRSSDIFLYSFLNPPCPNSVIEAIACGLPVVSFRSGAMVEICGFNDQLLVPLPDRVIHTYDQFDPERYADRIEEALKGYEGYRENARSHSEVFDFEFTFQKYRQALAGWGVSL